LTEPRRPVTAGDQAGDQAGDGDALGLVALLAWSVVVGVVSGLAGAGFLVSLDAVTDLRLDRPWLLAGLPLAGLVTGLVYHHLGGAAARGSNLILDEIHEPTAWVPRRMAPLVLGGTLLTHLCGGSAGREGTAIQLSGALADALGRWRDLAGPARRQVLVTAVAGGFGAVFGVPLAGTVFALEVQALGRRRVRLVVPAAVAAVVGDLVVRGLGVQHTATPSVRWSELSAGGLSRLAVLGVVAGLVARAFIAGAHGARRLFGMVPWAPARPVVGGAAVVALTAVVGSRDYLGLSVPLASAAFVDVAAVALGAWALKGLFTVVTLGSGFQGGEVTPLLVIGATLGASVAQSLGTTGPVLPAAGHVAVLAGAANTPLAGTVMAGELFGWPGAVAGSLACSLAYVVSGPASIYAAQRRRHPVHALRNLRRRRVDVS
jgi:H+/Cl- antiporter ClcA